MTDNTPHHPDSENVSEDLSESHETHIDNSDSIDQSEEMEPEFDYDGPSRGYVEEDPFSDDEIDSQFDIPLPSTKISNVNSSLETYTPPEDGTPSEEEVEWAGTVKNSMETSLAADALSEKLENKDSLYKQSIDFNGKDLKPTTPVMKKVKGQELTGNAAILTVVNTLGLGTIFQVPLWHSGLWITIKPPTEAEVVELFRLLDSSTIELGRTTGGLIYSNMAVVTARHVYEFIEKHIYNTTLKGWQNYDLSEIIKTQDLFPLIAGIATTMYPKGFTFKRACVADVEKCKHVVSGTVDIKKMFFTNIRDLSEVNKAHMAIRKPNTYTLDDINRYQMELLSIKGKRVRISKKNSLYVELKSPTISDYIKEGELWVNSIVELIDETLSTDDKEKRNELINLHTESTILNQYLQWVDTIHIEDNIIKNTKDVRDTLAVLSQDDDIRRNITKAILKYIDMSTISLIGIPAYECPSCGADQSDENAPTNFKTIIPVDTLSLFFLLVAQKRTRIVLRHILE